jgi:hypothetical protein
MRDWGWVVVADQDAPVSLSLKTGFGSWARRKRFDQGAQSPVFITALSQTLAANREPKLLSQERDG